MRVYKIREFAKMLNVSMQTLRNWDKNGFLKAYRTSGNVRFYTDEHLEEFKRKVSNRG